MINRSIHCSFRRLVKYKIGDFSYAEVRANGITNGFSNLFLFLGKILALLNQDLNFLLREFVFANFMHNSFLRISNDGILSVSNALL